MSIADAMIRLGVSASDSDALRAEARATQLRRFASDARIVLPAELVSLIAVYGQGLSLQQEIAFRNPTRSSLGETVVVDRWFGDSEGRFSLEQAWLRTRDGLPAPLMQIGRDAGDAPLCVSLGYRDGCVWMIDPDMPRSDLSGIRAYRARTGSESGDYAAEFEMLQASGLKEPPPSWSLVAESVGLFATALFRYAEDED